MRCAIVGEVGLSHNGSADLAHKLIDVAVDAGLDIAKFQMYAVDDFLSPASGLRYNGRDQYEMFREYELPDWVWPQLKAHCDARGIGFAATPTSERMLEMLVALEPAFVKNGSDFLLNLPLIEAMAATGLPTILSLGMATNDEVEEAVRAFDGVCHGTSELTLMHCTSTYPTVAADVNLRRISTLSESWGTRIGFSDHTDGITAAVGAVALGVVMVEKHITPDRALSGPDHHFSADPQQLRDLVSAVREMEVMLGDPRIGPTVSEQQGRRDYRVTPDAAGVYLRRG